MGKGALIAAVAVVFSTLLMLFDAQIQSNETDTRENAKRSLEVARELAMLGRKLVLTDWIQNQNNGITGLMPFDTLKRDGGKFWISSWDNPGNDTVDFAVQAVFDSTVHEVRSRYSWSGFGLNPVQMKAGAINPTISDLANLNDLDAIVLDDQSLQDLHEVLVDDLELIDDLSDYGLGLQESHDELETALDGAGFTDLADNILMVDEDDRSAYDDEEGLFYPDQISEAVEVYAAQYPSEHQQVSDFGSLGSTFGDGAYSMLTVEGNLNVTSDFAGTGILVVEGDFHVQPGVNFNWSGVILVKPPQADMTPSILLGGNVTIDGAFVALHEGLPNTGHMDVSVYRDMNGVWASPFGAEAEYGDILQHTHDFTSLKGNRVVFHSDNGGEPDHEGQTRFNQTMDATLGDSVYFEIYNHLAHGRGIIRMDRTTTSEIVQTVSHGFVNPMADSINVFRSVAFPPAELEHFDVAITRLSSLKKMWDNGEPYDGCVHPDDPDSGPACVWAAYDRFGSLTIRLYQRTGLGDKMIYGASLYWHRRQDEEEDFNNEMAALADSLQSPDYGLDLNIGDNVTIRGDASVLLNLGAFAGLGSNFGVANLGTWHRQWRPSDSGYPSY